jgi:hypothetical protein
MIIEKLAIGDITKIEAVLNTNHLAVLHMLSYWKESDNIKNPSVKRS